MDAQTVTTAELEQERRSHATTTRLLDEERNEVARLKAKLVAQTVLKNPVMGKVLPVTPTPDIEDAMAKWLTDVLGMDASITQFGRLYRAILAAAPVPLPAAPTPNRKPVAQICGTWELRWVGSGPIAPIVNEHGLKIGDYLYAAPAAEEIS